jgi:ribosomal protein S18 acetylase RimI-like enzyme
MSYKALFADWGGTLMSMEGEEPGPMRLWKRVAAMPGALEALDALGASGAQAYLLTNAADSGPEDIRAALARVGLDSRIAGILCSRELGARKPESAFYDAALNVAGLRPHEALMLGDDPEADCAGAEARGIDSVLYDPEGRHAEFGGRRIRSWAELPALFRAGPPARPPLLIERTDDLELIVEGRAAFIREMAGGNQTPERVEAAIAAYLKWCAARLAEGSLISFIGREGGKGPVMACAGLMVYALPPLASRIDRRQGHVLNVWVAPRLRGRGHGKALMRDLEDAAREAGLFRLFLNATAMGEPLYRPLGFHEQAEKALVKEL